jgi:DNA-directed RNA polymerase subunit H (RpoH/RPB5)
MEQSKSDEINQFYKSRKNMIEMLEFQGYNVDDYKLFGNNEVDSMFQTKQMDMLVKMPDGQKKTYVKYHLGKSMRPVNIYEYVDDLFNLDEILTKKDNLVIIMKDEPNETTQKTLQHMWKKDGIFIIIINIKRLQYNIMKHELVPAHIVLNEERASIIRIQYNIKDDSQIPDISRFSPVAQAIGIRPGELCEIQRPSKTAVMASFYRICSS